MQLKYSSGKINIMHSYKCIWEIVNYKKKMWENDKSQWIRCESTACYWLIHFKRLILYYVNVTSMKTNYGFE